MKLKRTLLLTGAGVAVVAGAAVCWAMWGPLPNVNLTVDRQSVRIALGSPEIMTGIGVVDGSALDFHSGKLDDLSPESFAADRKALRRYLQELRGFDPESLSGQALLTRLALDEFYAGSLALMETPWATPGGPVYAVDQLNGAPGSLPQFMEGRHRVADRRSAERYIQRLQAFPRKFDQLAHWARFQAEQGVVPPDFVVERTIALMEGFIAPDPAANVLVTSVATKLEAIADMPQAEREALALQAIEVVEGTVYPAYRRLIDLFRTELAPKAPADAGVWRLPGGDDYYAAALRYHTTTDLGAEEIHRIGLEEVARITAAMDTILRGLGLTEGTVGERMAALGKEPAHLYANDGEGRAAALADLRAQTDEMLKLAPEWFLTLPPQPLEIRPVPDHATDTSPGGYYNAPALDGSLPGVFYINLGDMNRWPRWSLPTLTYHEAVPGHHFQLSLAQKVTGVPLFRRVYPFVAYAEGWALYAERLAWEMGLYADDPHGDLGRLQSELFRAARLVVDTGLHHARWGRDEAIDYMAGVTGMEREGVRIEVERYAVMPGQACAYKLGELKILDLRAKARAKLGDRFDIRRFHDVVLGNGGLPLTVLERVVEDWIAETLGAGGGAVARAG